MSCAALVQDSVRTYKTEAYPRDTQLFILDCRGTEPVRIVPNDVGRGVAASTLKRL